VCYICFVFFVFFFFFFSLLLFLVSTLGAFWILFFCFCVVRLVLCDFLLFRSELFSYFDLAFVPLPGCLRHETRRRLFRSDANELQVISCLGKICFFPSGFY